MKSFTFVLFNLVALLAYGQNQEVVVPPFKTTRINFPSSSARELNLDIFSSKGLNVAVLDTSSGRQVKGFGLGARAKANLTMEQGQVLKLTNNTNGKALVQVNFTPLVVLPAAPDATYIAFTLSNRSLKAIPLIIPGVMNPNLSPLSVSGVSLQMGQEIFFRHKGQQMLLLTVNEEIKEGQKIDVAELISKRKQER